MIDRPQSVIEHLQELRRRILYALVAIFLAILAAVVYADDMFRFILASAKGVDAEFVQTAFGDAFLTQFRLVIMAGLVLAFPVVLYQLAAFVLPALRPSERRLLYVGLPVATGLFCIGWSFGWFVVMPITRDFFMQTAAAVGVRSMITPGSYVDFVLGICTPLGFIFELPLVVLILARIGLITAAFLSRIRKFAFLGLLIIAAVLSPPDVVSMGIFMVPLYGLYEVSILIARLVKPKGR